MPPQTIKVIKIVTVGKSEIQEAPLPQLKDDYILAKVKCVALNPTDWKLRDVPFLSTPGCTLGCDYAGVVGAVGPNLTKAWKKGDRIAGFVRGANSSDPSDGCFGEYTLAKAGLQYKIPENISFEQACCLGAGILTCGAALYQNLQLPLPGSGNLTEPILIYGASTASGSLAVQYAVLSGCSPIVVTCSPKNFAFAKSLGATQAFDYNDADCGKKIREYTQNKLTKAMDCISEGASPKICCDAISSEGGVISYLSDVKHDREDVQSKPVFGFAAVGEPVKFGDFVIPAQPEAYEFSTKFVELSTPLIASSKLVAHPPQVGEGGLQGVLEGLEMLKAKKVSATKLVYRLDETE